MIPQLYHVLWKIFPCLYGMCFFAKAICVTRSDKITCGCIAEIDVSQLGCKDSPMALNQKISRCGRREAMEFHCEQSPIGLLRGFCNSSRVSNGILEPTVKRGCLSASFSPKRDGQCIPWVAPSSCTCPFGFFLASDCFL